MIVHPAAPCQVSFVHFIDYELDGERLVRPVFFSYGPTLYNLAVHLDVPYMTMIGIHRMRLAVFPESTPEPVLEEKFGFIHLTILARILEYRIDLEKRC